VPVCSPRLIETHGPFEQPEALARVPLIHDDTLAHRANVPTWADWFAAAGVDGVDVSHGLRFNSSDHALDATGEGAGVLLAHDLLAYDDLRTGRLVIPIALTLPSDRAYHLVRPKRQRESAQAQAFRHWIKQEVAMLDWRQFGQPPDSQGRCRAKNPDAGRVEANQGPPGGASGAAYSGTPSARKIWVSCAFIGRLSRSPVGVRRMNHL
jgi:Transcriptional regulator